MHYEFAPLVVVAEPSLWRHWIDDATRNLATNHTFFAIFLCWRKGAIFAFAFFSTPSNHAISWEILYTPIISWVGVIQLAFPIPAIIYYSYHFWSIHGEAGGKTLVHRVVIQGFTVLLPQYAYCTDLGMVPYASELGTNAIIRPHKNFQSLRFIVTCTWYFIH